MNKCSYCNGELKTINSFRTKLFKGIDADFSLWINTEYLCLTLDAINGYDPGADVIELISKKITYCPMCGRKLEVEKRS